MFLTWQHDESQIKASYIQSMSDVCFVLSLLDLAQSGADLNACFTVPFRWTLRPERLWKVWHNVEGDLAGSAELSR